VTGDGREGTYVVTSAGGENVRAFIPASLPPDPPLSLGPADFDLLEEANRALGRLDGLATVLPDTSLLVYTYVRLSTTFHPGMSELEAGMV
jgi:hypothetical protein